MTAPKSLAVSFEVFTALPFIFTDARVYGYGIRFTRGASTHAMQVARSVLTATPSDAIVKFSLNFSVLLGSKKASMKPMSVARANIFMPIPHFTKRNMAVKTRKLTQPKIAVALVGDIPSFMPPGKIPFITHMCKQAQNVPTIPEKPLATACPNSGLTVKTNKHNTNGMRAWMSLGKGFRTAGTQMMLPITAIQTTVRNDICRAPKNL